MEEQLILSLLGLPSDASPERIRATYEGAVAAATARGDWARANALSSAFDKLPSRIRLAVYSGRGRDAARWETLPQARRRHTAPGRRVGRIWLAGALAVVCLLAVAGWVKHDLGPGHAPLVAPTAAATVAAPSPADAGQHRNHRRTHTLPRWVGMKPLHPGLGEVRVPANAVVDSRGRARVICPQAADGRVWHEVRVRPRQLFVCPSGLVGRVLVRSQAPR